MDSGWNQVQSKITTDFKNNALHYSRYFYSTCWGGHFWLRFLLKEKGFDSWIRDLFAEKDDKAWLENLFAKHDITSDQYMKLEELLQSPELTPVTRDETNRWWHNLHEASWNGCVPFWGKLACWEDISSRDPEQSLPDADELNESLPADEPQPIEEPAADEPEFMGCFKDQKWRDLPHRQANFQVGDRETCFQRCQAEGYKFAGLQWHNQCFCGNEFGKYGRGDKCNCNRGSRDFGYWHQCIYNVSGAAVEERPTTQAPTTQAPTTTEAPTTTVATTTQAPTTTAPAKADPCKVEYNIDHPGGDYNAGGLMGRVKGNLTYEQCFEFCAKDKKCIGFTWVKGEKTRDNCAVKTRYGKAKKHSGCDSVRMTDACRAAATDKIEPEVEMLPVEEAKPEFIGCWKDKPQRDLPHRQPNIKLGDRETCFKTCKAKGYKYAGLQWHQQCFCGNEYGSYGKGDESRANGECNCNNDKKYSFWGNCVYDLAAGDVQTMPSEKPRPIGVKKPVAEEESSSEESSSSSSKYLRGGRTAARGAIKPSLRGSDSESGSEDSSSESSSEKSSEERPRSLWASLSSIL